MVKLSEVSTLITKGTTPTTIGGKFVDKGINFIKVESITDNGEIDYNKLAHIEEETHRKLARSQIEKDDVLLSIAGDIGRCTVANADLVPANTNQAVAIIRLVNSVLLPDYLRYHFCLESSRKALLLANAQSIQSNVNLKNVGDYQISIPHITVQKKIISQLSAIDELIRTNREIIATSEKLMHEIYDYWFIQFDFPDENGRPYKSSGGEMIFNDIIRREIPKSWKNVAIRDIADIKSGYSFQSSSYIDGGKYKIITIKNVQDGFIDYKTDSTLDDIPDKMPDWCNLGSGEILMSLTGNTGRIGLTFGEKALLNQRVAKIVLKSHTIQSKIEGLSNGSSQKNLSPIELSNIQVPYSESCIAKFAAITSPILDLIVESYAENYKLASLRDWLLPMLMNGQAKITD